MIKCDFCDHATSQKWQLKQHVRVSHLGEPMPSFPCRLCDFAPDTRRKLVGHLKSVHALNLVTEARLVSR